MAPIKNIQISVDSCAQLGGAPFECIEALKRIYDLTGMRQLTYVDTYQGFREKANYANPQIMHMLGQPISLYGRFIKKNNPWVKIYSTHKCKEFAETLAHTVFPDFVAPVFKAIEEITEIIRERAYVITQERNVKSISGIAIRKPEEVPFVFTPHDIYQGQKKLADPIINEAINMSMGDWENIVRRTPVLKVSRQENKKKGELIEFIQQVQEAKAIGYYILWKQKPTRAKRIGDPPELVKSEEILPLYVLLQQAHQFSHVNLLANGTDNYIHHQAIAQGIRMTTLWPWMMKDKLDSMWANRLKRVHHNVADEAALALFTNILPEKLDDPNNTLFILVTHDGPLMEEFAKFSTGVSVEEKKVPKKGGGIKKVDRYFEVKEQSYEKRGFTKRPPHEYPRNAIFTGGEFLIFLKGEVERVREKFAPTPELNEAIATLEKNIKSLRTFVDDDRQTWRMFNNWSYKELIRRSRQGARELEEKKAAER